PAVAALLDEVDLWRGLHHPPRFVLRALLALVSRNPGHPAWKRSLPGWLQLWDQAALRAEGLTLAVQVGLAASPAAVSEPPPGVAAVPWYLHLASRTLLSQPKAPHEPLACVRRALTADPQLTGLPEANLVREALPALERRALALSLALLVRPDTNQA